MRPRIYVSGPISLGCQFKNFQQFCEAFYALVEAGFAPFNPGLTLILPGNTSISHADWLAIDLPWVAVADAILRLPGESKGADEECGYARTIGIPVFDSIEELNKYLWNRNANV